CVSNNTLCCFSLCYEFFCIKFCNAGFNRLLYCRSNYPVCIVSAELLVNCVTLTGVDVKVQGDYSLHLLQIVRSCGCICLVLQGAHFQWYDLFRKWRNEMYPFSKDAILNCAQVQYNSSMACLNN